MAQKRKSRKVAWVIVWLLGVGFGCCVPSVLSYAKAKIHYTIGSACWNALIQFEQLKTQSSLLRSSIKEVN